MVARALNGPPLVSDVMGEFHHHRRDFLFGLGATLGTAALNALVQADEPANPLAPRAPHHRARADACIFLFMEGGPSHLDTFDPKPRLADLHMQEFRRQDRFASAMASGRRFYVQSPFGFQRAGRSGIPICDRFVHLPRVADEICLYRGCQAESIDHPTACYHLNTGNRFGGDPAVGAWVTYGLGTLNQNLPAFVVLPESNYPQGGTANWSSGFLPAHFQGTPLRPDGAPLLDLAPPPGVTRAQQRANLDLLARLNALDQARHPGQGDLAARMRNYELAFRMQAEVPDLVSIEREDQRTKDLYGIGQPATDNFGRRCLLARKLVEQGVRFVQVWSSGWDSHDYLERSHTNRIRSIDQPIAALITDLKRRGLLERTLIVWAGEFGRSPDNGVRGGSLAAGRDHNARGMTVWFAGGGVKAGHVIGATDELGERAVECVHPLQDLHVTILNLLGLDDTRLTYFHEGRFKQLSQTGGQVIREIIG
jgi:hypothetical protein